MPDLYTIKETEIPDTPLVLFECTFQDGTVERWSTNQILFEGHEYAARVVRYNAFEFGAASDETGNSNSKLSIVVSNVDSRVSQLERAIGFHGSTISVRFVFFDLEAGTATSAAKILFRGTGDSAAELTEAEARLVFQNRLSFQRSHLPQLRIQSRCPWVFPATVEQRQEALTGGDRELYSPTYRCGYSPDVINGVGNLDSTVPYASCDYTRTSCEQRGMLHEDTNGTPTNRFAGMELLPIEALRLSAGSTSAASTGEARYGDYVPLIYGTGWIQPQTVFGRNNGSTTILQMVLASGPIEGVLKVIANRVELPQFEAGKEMTATGWYRLVSRGNRNGVASDSFLSESGTSITPPYGSLAYLEVSLPASVRGGNATPRIDALVQGLQLPRFDSGGVYLDTFFTSNPAWMLLDILRRSGWRNSEIDFGSFGIAADFCDETISATDTNGNIVLIPRYRCNFSLTSRRSVAELLRGLRLSCGFYLGYSDSGTLQLRVEDTLARQQGNKPEGSNSVIPMAEGWPAYEFGDGTYGFSGIARTKGGEPSIRLWSRSAADSPNRLRVEFNDEFNLFQSDSFSLVDIDQSQLAGAEVSATLSTVGITNFSHANRSLRRILQRSTAGNCYVEFDTSIIGLGLKPGDIITVTYAKEGLDRRPFRITRLSAELNLRTIHIVAQAHDDNWYVEGNASIGLGMPQPAYGGGIPRPLLGSVTDGAGATLFEVSEISEEYADGTGAVSLSVAFSAPERPSPSVLRMPIVSVSPEIFTGGGALHGDRSVYYGVAGLDTAGSEGPLSFVVRADLPIGDTLRVQLNGLSFSAGTSAYRVYRGDLPSQWLRIATVAPIGMSFVDSGLPIQPAGPADEFFDHANFYWRFEVHPPIGVTTSGSEIVGSSGASFPVNSHNGRRVRIVSGLGRGQERTIVSNTASELTVSPKWEVVPNNTSEFVIAEGSWRFGATAWASPVTMQIPNRRDAVLHIQGRSANASNAESSEQLAGQTRWLIGGAAGSGGDFGIPEAPIYGLTWRGQGTVELVGVSFFSLANTNTVESGTLILHYFDELAGSRRVLSGAVDNATDTVDISIAGGGQVGDFIQIASEILRIEAVNGGGLSYVVSRGQLSTEAIAHTTGSVLWHLSRKAIIVTFPRSFFGSPASGAYSHAIYLPNARIAASQMFVTNRNGNSATRAVALTGSADYGLRTLSGGQFALQVEGHLAIQTSACPPLVVEDARSVRDIYAVVKDAPLGAPIELRLNRNGLAYTSLSIPALSTISNVVNGLELPPLDAGAIMTLDILSLGQGGETTPGRDLTVIIRL